MHPRAPLLAILWKWAKKLRAAEAMGAEKQEEEPGWTWFWLWMSWGKRPLLRLSSDSLSMEWS